MPYTYSLLIHTIVSYKRELVVLRPVQRKRGLQVHNVIRGPNVPLVRLCRLTTVRSITLEHALILPQSLQGTPQRNGMLRHKGKQCEQNFRLVPP